MTCISDAVIWVRSSAGRGQSQSQRESKQRSSVLPITNEQSTRSVRIIKTSVRYWTTIPLTDPGQHLQCLLSKERSHVSPQTGNSRHKKHCIDRLTLGDVNKDSAVKTKATSPRPSRPRPRTRTRTIHQAKVQGLVIEFDCNQTRICIMFRKLILFKPCTNRLLREESSLHFTSTFSHQ